jgi:Tol biopolymer transport system component
VIRAAAALACGAFLLAAVPALAGGGKTKLISRGLEGLEASLPAVSGNGRVVAFQSTSNVIGGEGSRTEVFVRNLRTGERRLVSVGLNGAEAKGDSGSASISGGGRYVAFQSSASNLVNVDSNGFGQIFVRDLKRRETRLVSVGRAGGVGNSESYVPSISADGRYVAFESYASNLAGGDPRGTQIFVRDLEDEETIRVSIGRNRAAANRHSFHPSISAHGRYVAFESIASNLVRRDRNDAADVFVRDLKTGQMRRVSVSSHEDQANGPSGRPSISAHGRYVAFESFASNLVPRDTNPTRDVFVRDLKSRKTRRVSVSSHRAQANHFSQHPSISASGRFVAFDSLSSNLVRDDANSDHDIFVRDRTTGRTRRVSVASNGGEGNADSYDPSTAASGRFVAFWSVASNLTRRDRNGHEADVFRRGPLR